MIDMLIFLMLVLIVFLLYRGISMLNNEQIIRVRNKVNDIRSNYKLSEFIVFPFKTIVDNCEDIKGIKEANFERYEDEINITINGAVLRENNKYTIFVNKNLENDEQKRLTIAHELGHYFLGHLKNDGILFSLSTDIAYDFDISTFDEKEANIFAVELLMPYDQCKSLRYYTDDELSNLFGVNKQAVKSRMEQLGLR